MIKVSSLLIFLSAIALPLRAHDSLNDSFKTERFNLLFYNLCGRWVSKRLLKKGKINSLDESEKDYNFHMTYFYNPMLKKGLTEKEYYRIKAIELQVAYESFESIKDAKKKRGYCMHAADKFEEDGKKFLDHIDKYHPKTTVPVSTKTQTDETSQVHDECLNARDYKGCVEVKSGNPSNTTSKESCAPYTICKPGKGNDMLGEPMIPNWPYTYLPDKQIVRYYGPISKLKVRGKFGRYIEMESIFREKRNPTQAIAPTSINLSPKKTTCTAKYNYVDCKTSPPVDITFPGKQASPGGIIQTSHRTVIDCKDQTYAIHNDGHVVGRWKTTKGTNHETVKYLLKSCDKINELPLSSFNKYAGK